MNEQHNLPPVKEGVFTTGQKPQLLGGYCPRCGHYHFPFQDYCSKCLGEMEHREIGCHGRIESVTSVRTKPPLGLPRPYTVAWIDLEETSLRVFSLIDPETAEEARIGSAVFLKILPLGVNLANEPCLRPCFSISEKQE
ncbi:Zn-ribbon domain-containing OB-fold protein [Emcibacter sp.]|uniref:Zn-ribbon domain-containing OB-fold protein n=1 Tax=Emcibacter sp. TaxID=1979954 RepID=UPI002AA5F465|nr:zinc ribbon domain-containing protein [Emcibacter sp.]